MNRVLDWLWAPKVPRFAFFSLAFSFLLMLLLYLRAFDRAEEANASVESCIDGWNVCLDALECCAMKLVEPTTTGESI